MLLIDHLGKIESVCLFLSRFNFELTDQILQTIGLPAEKVHVVSTQDTDITPFDTGAYASRQAYVVGNAVFKAASELKDKIKAYASLLLNIPVHPGLRQPTTI